VNVNITRQTVADAQSMVCRALPGWGRESAGDESAEIMEKEAFR
jgi:hypothetical protein